MPPTRILIVDDSAFMRLTLARRLGSEPGFEIAGVAADGQEALAQVQALKPDVITMDVEMPGMDGLTALGRIMSTRPTPVIMVSSLTKEGAETTVRALTLGAVDFVAKSGQISGTQQMVQEIAAKIRQVAGVQMPRLAATNQRAAAPAAVRPLTAKDKIIAVGSSTGGPGALRQLFAGLANDLDAAVVVVQHMPAGFTRSLAERLDEASAWTVREAAAGDRLMVGQALLAPGSFHMTFTSRGEAQLNQDPPVNNVRPAVDVTLRSLVEVYGGRVLGVILTGMGHDGRDGALLIRKAQGTVIAEAEQTCAVYGMPRSVVEAGAASYVAPLPEIPALIRTVLKENNGERR